jgi:prephenate dehydrogenase
MAGSHERGFEQSRSDLFDGAPCVVTEIENSPDQARLCAFWRALGCDVIVRGPAEHDVEAAWVSHVPHALAYGFAAALANAPLAARDVAGSGFRDFTRIARSDPEMWSEILTQNRKALAAPLQAVGEALAEIGRAIAADDADVVERRINAAREVLARYTNERTNGNAPPGDGHPVSKQR